MHAVFVFAHQDDEYGIFFRIFTHCRQGHSVHCVYLTDGGNKAARRNAESAGVLHSMGVAGRNIHFPGCAFSWRDGALFRHYRDCVRWLAAFFAARADIAAVYVPAWEGGHPDHDVAHAAAVEALQDAARPAAAWQFPLYNGYRCSGPLFKTMLPLPHNGPVTEIPIPIALRWKFVRLCLRYPSQWKSWTGLFPFVAAQYLFHGRQRLQRASPRLWRRPHDGPLYYERRNFCSWSTLQKALAPDAPESA